MKKLKYRTEMEGNAISDYISDHPVKNYIDEIVEAEDFYQDEAGNIFYLMSWKNTSYSDAETGHNTVHETSNEQYEKYLTAEERAELIKKEYNDNKSFYDKN